MITPQTPAGRPADPGTVAMQQVIIYISDQDRWHHRPLALAIVELVRAQGGAGATVLKGLAGYSAGSRAIHISNLVDVAANLPVVILIVDTAERIAALLPRLAEMVAPGGGLITVSDVAAYAYRHPGPAGRSDHLKVRQIMETQVQTVPPNMPVADLLPLLLNRYYKALPVVDGEGHVLGMVTDGDLLEKAGMGVGLSVLEAARAQGAPGLDAAIAAVRSSGRTAGEIMGRRPGAVIGPEASARDAARLMVTQNVKRLPVVDDEGRLLGILGRLDLLKAAAHVLPAPGHLTSAPFPVGVRTLGEVMLRDVPAVSADTPLATVVDTLVGSRGTRRVVVVDSTTARHVLGIISEADLVGRTAGLGHAGLWRTLRESLGLRGGTGAGAAAGLDGRVARDVMTSPAITARPTLSIVDGVRLMIEQGVKVLPVVDSDGQLVGVVNRARLLQALVG